MNYGRIIKYVPSPVGVIIVFGVAVILGYHATKSWKKQRSLSIAYIMFAIAGIGGALAKFGKGSKFVENYLGSILTLSGLCVLTAFVVLMKAAYRLETEPKAKREFKIIVISFISLFVICIGVILLAFYEVKVKRN